MSISTIIILAAAGWVCGGFGAIRFMSIAKKADRHIDEEYLRMRDERNEIH